MKPRAAELFVKMTVLALLISSPARAQGTSAALTGTVTDPSGAAVAYAGVSARSLNTGQSAQTLTDVAGHYTIPNLAAGEYEVSVSAQGFTARTAKVALTAGARETVNFALTTSSGSPSAPSLGDLGFPPAETKGSALEQARLDKRSHMLKVHQELGLITVAPMLAALFTANGAAGRHSTVSGRELHAALGGVTAGMYFTSAGFALFAPKIPGTTDRGPIRLHKALAWIHGPGMILTPILGALAYEQLNRGERVHGIASAHSAVAVTTSAAYGLAILSLSLKF